MEVKRRQRRGERVVPERETAGPSGSVPSGSRSPAELEQLPPTSMCLGCKRFLLYLSQTLLLLVIFVWAYPSPINPVAFQYSNKSNPQFTGPLAINDLLQRGERLFENQIRGPEALVLSEDGYIYSGLGDGHIIKINSDLSSFATITRTGVDPTQGVDLAEQEEQQGRPLGMVFNSKNKDELYITDSSLGLLRLNVRTKSKETLISKQNSSVPINFLNDLIELPNGSLLISDSSLKFSRRDNEKEALECGPNGQLLLYDPAAGSLRVVVAEMHFPNGLCPVGDGESVLVAETMRARILRYYFAGSKAGSLEVFSDNLIGWPDNISPSSRGGYWVGTAVVRFPVLNFLAGHLVFLRSVIAKFHLMPVLHMVGLPPTHGLVLELDAEGKVVRSLHDQGGKLTATTSHILEIDESLVIGSYHERFLIRVRL